MQSINKKLTNEEIDDLVKELINMPIEKNNKCLSSYGSINVDELISVVKEMRKVPTYDNLLKENQKLKEENDHIKNFIKDKINKINKIIDGYETELNSIKNLNRRKIYLQEEIRNFKISKESYKLILEELRKSDK